MRAEKKGIKAIQGRLINGTGSPPTKQAILMIEGERMKNGKMKVNRGL
jgi:hypothetical protein